jgi:polyhydroxybutyrate depolymerase
MNFEQKRAWRRVCKSEESSSGGALQCVEQRSDESTPQTWMPGAFSPEANCPHALAHGTIRGGGSGDAPEPSRMSHGRFLLHLLLLLLLLAGLATFSTSAAQAAPDRRSTIRYGGLERSYYVHLPTRYRPGQRLPLVILLHGGGGGARQALGLYPLEELADREGFVLVAPDGTGPLQREILRTWNVGFGFGYAQRNHVDDVGFLRALILDLESRLAVDPHRVYLTGLSNGAILCHWAAAANSDLIAGIAPVVGTVGGRGADDERMLIPNLPAHPLDVILFNGEMDEHIPLQGGLQKKWADLGGHRESRKYVLSAKDSALFWVKADGCSPVPKVEEIAAQDCTRTTWAGGKNGTRVVLYVLHHQGHAWPGGLPGREEADAPSNLLKAHEVLWEFFSERLR